MSRWCYRTSSQVRPHHPFVFFSITYRFSALCPSFLGRDLYQDQPLLMPYVPSLVCAGIVLVDPVTLGMCPCLALSPSPPFHSLLPPCPSGCGHTFGKAALLEYLRRRPQADRRCLLCNWAIPADLQLRIDPLVAYILARYDRDHTYRVIEIVRGR